MVKNRHGQTTIEYALALLFVMFFTVGIYLLFDEPQTTSGGAKKNAMEMMYGRMEYGITRPYP